MIKLVLSDLDNTLLWQGERHVATPFAIEAIHTLQDAGVHFAPCTGRVWRNMGEMFADDERCYQTAVLCNGLMVYLDGRLIDDHVLTYEQLAALQERLETTPDMFMVTEYDDGRKVVVNATMDYVHERQKDFWTVNAASKTVLPESCHKVNIRVMSSWERTLQLRDWLNAELPDLSITCPIPGRGMLDVAPAGMGKEMGAEALMERLELDADEVCVFGDADNDLSIIRHFPNSVAVAGAMDSVLEAARWRIGPAEQDSVAHALLDIARAAADGRMPSFMTA